MKMRELRKINRFFQMKINASQQNTGIVIDNGTQLRMMVKKVFCLEGISKNIFFLFKSLIFDNFKTTLTTS